MNHTFNEMKEGITNKIEALEAHGISCEQKNTLLEDISSILKAVENQRVNSLEATKQAVHQNEAKQQEILIEHQRHNLFLNQMIDFFTQSKERIESTPAKDEKSGDNDLKFKKDGDFFIVNASDFQDILINLKCRVTKIQGYVTHLSTGNSEKLTLNAIGAIRPPMGIMIAKNSVLNISYMEGVCFCEEESCNKTVVLVQ